MMTEFSLYDCKVYLKKRVKTKQILPEAIYFNVSERSVWDYRKSFLKLLYKNALNIMYHLLLFALI